MKNLLFFILVLYAVSLRAQSVDTVYTETYLRKSSSFAWTTFGGDLFTAGSGKTDYQTVEGSLDQTTFGPVTTPRLSIGGVHFWGYADFYVSLPLPVRFGSRPGTFSDMVYKHGIETGARIYPFRLKPGRISPYIGTSFRLLSYGHQTANTSYSQGFPESQRMIVPLQAGVTYTSRTYLFTLGFNYQSLQNMAYAISPVTFGTTSFNPISVNIGLVRYIDTDRDFQNSKVADQLNKKHYILKHNRRLSDWYVGIGPSAGLPRPLGRSSYITRYHPYLQYEAIGGFMPDLTAGRYFHKPDLNVGLSYRTMRTRATGFDADVRLQRHSFMLEGYKYLFNYLGFAPYVGPTLAIEQLSLNDTGQRFRETKIAVGLIVGWDIRVTNTEISLLRTNLRWTPNLYLTAKNEQVLFDNIEFNFIQYVRFLGRKSVYQSHRAKS